MGAERRRHARRRGGRGLSPVRLRFVGLLSSVVVATGTAVTLPAVADSPAQRPMFVRLSDTGPAFLSYDGGASFDRRTRDWHVSLIFAGHANVGKVKQGLRRLGLTRRGSARFLAYRVGQETRFDGDRGLKTACDPNGTDVHVRLYAPTATDRFVDPEYGSVVVGTTHLDRADGCRVPPKLFGFSEIAEQRVGTLVRKLGWRVQFNRLELGNAEPYRRDIADPAHIWLGDGRATLITVP
jgi:hypothetical protein